MTLDSSRTHRSDPEGLIQSYVLRVEEKNRLAESEWKKIEEAKKAKALADEKVRQRTRRRMVKIRFLRQPNARRNGIGQASIATRTRRARGSRRWRGHVGSGTQAMAATDGLVLPAAEGEREEAEPTAWYCHVPPPPC
uniref:Uncharacterized protein n=1 Tax=Guillardia theta TaxID=55529 RepID=A0A6U6CKY6_GUITH|mmetsp:Transcript_47361/g.148115  ORF Transcript_47361/g.148115 Transcript_47361/m.148115 type:complete len:138 (+) Transcript_47361:225-638(+)